MANNRNDLTKTINQLHPGDIAVLRNGFVPGRSISDIYDRTSGKFTTVGGPGSPYGALQTQIQSQENLAKAFKENAKLYESINGEEKKQYGEIAKKAGILIPEVRLLKQHPKVLFASSPDPRLAMQTGLFSLLQIQTRYIVALAKSMGVSTQSMGAVVSQKTSWIGGILTNISENLSQSIIGKFLPIKNINKYDYNSHK